MPKCPKCKAEIDSLNYVESGLMEYCTNLQEWLKSESADIEYTCPECGERVFLDQVIPDPKPFPVSEAIGRMKAESE